MKIEILSKATGSLVKKDITSHVEMDVSENERMGSELDTLKFTVSPVTKEECFEPGTCIRFTYDDGTSQDFAVVSDTVKIAQKGSTKGYTHEIQCVDYVRKLCYRVMRGKDLSQPYSSPRKAAYLNQIFSTYYDEGKTPYPSNYRQRTLNLTQVLTFPNERLTGGLLTCQLYVMYLHQKDDGTYETGTYYKKEPSTSEVSVTAQVVTTTGKVVCTINGLGNGADHYLTASEISSINTAIAGYSELKLKLVSATEGYLNDGQPQMYACLRLTPYTYRYTYMDVLKKITQCATTSYLVHPKDSEYSYKQVEEDLPFKIAYGNEGISNEMLDLPAPDFQFQQNTSVYDAVAEVLKTLGLKPTLKVNQYDGDTLDAEPLNERNKQITKDNFIDEMRSVTDSKRVNAVVLPYQNGAPKTTINYPMQVGSSIRYATPRGKNLGLETEQDYYLTVNNPIYQVNRMFASIPNSISLDIGILIKSGEKYDYQASSAYWREYDASSDGSFDWEITDFVFDETSYNLLDTYNGDSILYKATQSNSLKYAVGDNGIFVGGQYTRSNGKVYYIFPYAVESAFAIKLLGGIPERNGDAWNRYDMSPYDFKARCVYYPISSSGNVRIESPIEKNYGDNKETECVLSQSSGILSLEKLGLSALGSVSMLGEETMTAVYRAYCYTTKKPLRGMWIKDGTDYWIVQDAKSTQLIDGTYKAILTLSKGFNKVSDRVQIDRSLRMTEISQNLVLKSEAMFRDYIYFTVGDFPKSQLTGTNGIQQYTALTSHGFAKIYGGLFNWYWGRQTQTTGIYHQGATNAGIVAPTVCYGAGNSICFETNFTSPTSAGNYTEKIGSVITTKPILYTRDNGFITTCDYAIIDGDATAVEYGTDPFLKYDYESGLHTYFDLNYDGKIVGISDLDAWKTPNDILGLNYQIFLLPYQGGQVPMIIYPYLASHHPYVSGKPWQPLKLYINTSSTPYSMFESTPRGTLINSNVDFHMMSVAEDSTTTMNKCEKVQARNGANTFDWIYTPSACNGWMLTEQNGTPLLASNKSLGSGSLIYFHVFASHKRL